MRFAAASDRLVEVPREMKEGGEELDLTGQLPLYLYNLCTRKHTSC